MKEVRLWIWIMKDLFNILGKIESLDAAGEAYAMATLVQVSGSTYRGIGARMLNHLNGKRHWNNQRRLPGK